MVLSGVGLALAVLAVATGRSDVTWAAIVVLSAAVLFRLLTRRRGRPEGSPPETGADPPD